MREKSELRRFTSNPALPARLTEMSVAPGGSFRLRRMLEVWREWRHLVLHQYMKLQELTSAEIVSIEARVRKELYP
jgi:hypothetical protein